MSGKFSWSDGGTCDASTVISVAFHERIRGNRLSLTKYLVATTVLTGVLAFLSGEMLIIAVGVIFALAVSGVMFMKNRDVAKTAASIKAGNFQWMVGKVESRYHRSMLDISSATQAYQIRCRGQWVDVDAATYTECEDDQRIILISCNDKISGIPLPSGVTWRKGALSLAHA